MCGAVVVVDMFEVGVGVVENVVGVTEAGRWKDYAGVRRAVAVFGMREKKDSVAIAKV